MTNQTIETEEDDYSLPGLLADTLPVAGDGAASTEIQSVRVPISLAGERLDRALAVMFPQHSRSRLAQLIKELVVTLDGHTVAGKHIVTGGELVRIALRPRAEDLAFTAEPIALDVLYEDATVAVINKPPGMVVHPAAGNWQGTLLNGLLHRYENAARIPRAGIVHRLDKDTSGVMMVARSEQAQLALVRQLQARAVKREYLALVRGHPPSTGTVDSPIGRHPKDRIRMAVVPEDRGGKPAVTHFSVVESFELHSVVRCRLETGRTHQIRVHMQSIGFPLEGDPVYTQAPPSRWRAGLRNAIAAFNRQALHAQQLAFDHPDSGERMQFAVPIAEDFQVLLNTVAEQAA